MRDLAYDFAEFAAGIRYEDLPASTVQATKNDIFDSLSTGIAGSSAKGISQLIEYADECGGTEQATTFVFGRRYPAQIAAMLNTVMIHGYDYDDTHEVAMMHSGAIVVSCALAAAEKIGGVSGKEFIAAVTAGLEIHCRLGIASTIGIAESGYVYTPLLGIFGGTAAAGRIMGLNEDEMINALGIAYAQCAGNYQAITDSAWTKRIQPGFASQAAINAVSLAKKGVIGAKNIFEGKFGLYHVYLHDRYNPEIAREGLGTKFVSEDIAFKPWPCGRPSQPPINAAIEIKEKYNIDPAHVAAVEIAMNEHLVVGGCTPEDIRKKPATIVDAQFSIPYGVACGLVNGKLGLADFTDEKIKRADVLAMAAKVEGVVDPEIEKNYHGVVPPVIIRVTMDDGTKYEHRLDITIGCKERPMTPKAIAEKMDDCVEMAALTMPEDTARKIRSLVDGLDSLENTDEIIKAMQAQ